MKPLIFKTVVAYLTCFFVTFVVAFGIGSVLTAREPARHEPKLTEHRVRRVEFVTARPTTPEVPSVMAQLDAVDRTWSYLDAQ